MTTDQRTKIARRKLSLLEVTEHRTTKVRRPQNNDFYERFQCTLLEKCLRVQGRTKWYEALEEMQKDLDVYRVNYNTKAAPGRGMKGRTPYQAFPKEDQGGRQKPAGNEVKKAA